MERSPDQELSERQIGIAEVTMGVWGAGLYSGDFALDLRSTIGALARLPFDADRLLEILCQTESAAADDPDQEDHTTFWLVVSDQFTKRGIACDRAREKALTIIDSGSDLAVHAELGMSGPDLRKRRKILDDLRVRLTKPPASARRPAVLKEPQRFLMDVGDVFVYPTCGGRCINPYFASKEQDRAILATGWKQDGWSACVVVDRGRVFDFLAWYRPLTISAATLQKPTIATLQGGVVWKLAQAGTCPSAHFKRMELERIGTLSIDGDKLRRWFPVMPPGTFEAIDNVSLANALNVGPASALVAYNPRPEILGIEQVLSS